jgi:nucleoside-diphosphate-sugar epimerase
MEIKKQFMDSTRLRQAAGWVPNNKFEEILPETVRWYLNHYEQK